MGKNRGFTLIELMVTIAILAIIATLAAPSFGNFVAEQKLNGSTREILLSVDLAKSRASLMKSTVALCLNKTNTDDDLDANECAIQAAIPGYSAMSPAEKLEVQKTRVVLAQINPDVVVRSTSGISILVNDVGGASAPQTFDLCKSGKQKTITVTRLGIITQTPGTC
ncbi:pilus assembly FimT family protein [Acinetobacter junii]|uniref:pilus assembly FimT family protein n=1 Tax=Acinetobacter junii TaxID=40215 RepID=UPI00100EE01C|nr:prepilin-type N-terminal cleavage/methylation domain-containing protein [Acinetobacter junii]RXS99728.1 prepilin-type N-terminal cleavage/methylation domain-containing protein [Acinetobacter junii]